MLVSPEFSAAPLSQSTHCLDIDCQTHTHRTQHLALPTGHTSLNQLHIAIKHMCT
jgi:hypothetical protein